ncbi:MAG: AsmA family protein, partial [Candidatus Omnitrophica bacterium]|nr:AsmA family protein [Candidatus Omnitrophota bacterium]
MKKIIITLIALFLIAAAALAIFIVTFDAERYRGLIETKATELTGFPVKLGGISLTWKNGLALQVRDLELKIHEEDTDPAPVSVGSAFVALEVMPLLRGSVQMGSIVVENPEVRVTRSPDGRLHGAAELGEAKPSQQTNSSTGAESTLALLIQNLNIRGGKFIFLDQYGGRVREYTIEQIELHLSDVSLLSPFPVELKAAVFSGKQNLTLAGKVHVRLTKQELDLRDFSLNTDLSDLDIERLSQAFPEMREMAVPVVAGQIQASLSDMTVSEHADPVLNARITLNQGRVAFPEMDAVENIALESEVTAEGLQIESLSADWAGGQLASSLNLDWRKVPFMGGSFQAVVSGMDLAQAVPAPASSRDPGVTGTLSADLRGTFAGADADIITRSLAANGQVLVKDAVITNLNVVKEVLNKLSIIPGVSEKIQSRLSEDYLRKLEERDTRLEDVTLPLRISEGFLFADS